jgi:hypothetical protein
MAQGAVFSTIDKYLSFIARTLASMKLRKTYDGFLYLADST